MGCRAGQGARGAHHPRAREQDRTEARARQLDQCAHSPLPENERTFRMSLDCSHAAYLPSSRYWAANTCSCPGATFTVSSAAFAVSTQTIRRYPSGSKSPIFSAFSIHGFQTTVERLPVAVISKERSIDGSRISHAPPVSK